jgi:hypothetical protein
MSATAVATSQHPCTERVRRHKDGSVLLSIAEDRVCKLNGVGALTWMVLEDASSALTLDQIVAALEQQFAAINSEGELHFEVSRQQLTADTQRFLNKMLTMRLLEVRKEARGHDCYSVRGDVSGTTSAATTTELEVEPENDNNTKGIAISGRETFSAFVGLLAFDLLLKFVGFQALIKRVERWPTAQPRRTDPEISRRVRAMVDRAQMYYPKKAMCLQHSAVVTCLLRRRGVPAEMILAAQDFPPKAHAWTEVMNEVVSDSPRVKAKYRELRRL